MGFSLIGGSCLEVEDANPSILKTEPLARHPLPAFYFGALAPDSSGVDNCREKMPSAVRNAKLVQVG